MNNQILNAPLKPYMPFKEHEESHVLCLIPTAIQKTDNRPDVLEFSKNFQNHSLENYFKQLKLQTQFGTCDENYSRNE